MKITCQSCQSKYNVADEKVQGKIVKIRCRKCGSTIVVQGNDSASTNGAGAAGTSPSAAGPQESESPQWHVNIGDSEPKTMTIAEVVDAYNAGAISQDTFIWTDGMDDWKRLAEVDAVMAALPAAHPAALAHAAAPPAEARSGFQAPLPGDDGAYAAAAPSASEPEPRRAAVAKREARAKDLFNTTGASTEEVQTSAPSVPQMMSASAVDDTSKMTGQRNENSVLFSLAVLTKDADDRAPEAAASKAATKNTEDSGLIDLKALALKAESMRPQGPSESNAFASPLGLGPTPLGAPLSVLGGPLGDAAPKSKLPLIIGGGAAVAVLLVLGIVIGVKLAGSNGAAPDSNVAASAAAPTFAPSSEPSAPPAAVTAEPSSVPAPTASASVAAKPKTPAGGYHSPSGGAGKPIGGGTASTGGPSSGATPPATPPPPKKPGSDCGCNGDLMCLMKCSTH